MPVIAAIVGAITTGLMYWFVWGNGMSHLDQWLYNKRNIKRRTAAIAEAQSAPIRALKESRDGATALMALVAHVRGEPTPEQLASIKEEMRDVLGYGDDLEARLIAARHAIGVAASPDSVVLDLRDLLQNSLTKAEFNQLFLMLRKVAALHGGPTEAQERIVAFAERQLPPHA
ncbi:hypothetical protein [Terrarubrum flagellatum]|uniref:hypothetical protein n=1 Tax=Terrirubrum flagellatum TaxID=2895980 RepID=UPI0031452AB0